MKMDKIRQHILNQVRNTHPDRHWQYTIDIAKDKSIAIIEGYGDLSQGSWVDGAMGIPPAGKTRVILHLSGDPWFSYAILEEALHAVYLDAKDRGWQETEGQRIMEEENVQ